MRDSTDRERNKQIKTKEKFFSQKISNDFVCVEWKVDRKKKINFLFFFFTRRGTLKLLICILESSKRRRFSLFSPPFAITFDVKIHSYYLWSPLGHPLKAFTQYGKFAKKKRSRREWVVEKKRIKQGGESTRGRSLS